MTGTKLTAHIMTDMHELDLDDDAPPFPPDCAEISTKLDLYNDAAPPAPPDYADISMDVAEARLFRCNADIKEAVKQWCDPATREAALARYGHISDWNMTEVSDCNELFKDQAKFNDDISRWDMSNVKSMDFMFFGATAFKGA